MAINVQTDLLTCCQLHTWVGETEAPDPPQSAQITVYRLAELFVILGVSPNCYGEDLNKGETWIIQISFCLSVLWFASKAGLWTITPWNGFNCLFWSYLAQTCKRHPYSIPDGHICLKKLLKGRKGESERNLMWDRLLVPKNKGWSHLRVTKDTSSTAKNLVCALIKSQALCDNANVM